MKKRYVIPIVGALASVGVGYVMKNRRNDDNNETTLADSLVNAGKPDQLNHEDYDHAQLENAKMVSEGSQFGVQYYNEHAEEIMDQLEERITE